VSLKLLKQTLKDAPIVKKGDYSYFVHPITDGIPEIQPELLQEVANEMKKHIKKCGNIDKIVTIEAMGIPLATLLAIKMNIPFTIVRKREYGLKGEISVEQKTGYSNSKLYVNGLKKGDNIVIVDDVLSTGGTLRAVLSVLQKIGVNVKGVFIAVNKGKCDSEIMNKFNTDIKSIIKVNLKDEHIQF
jgi:adenine phosphoribosyltransferase